ncbi:hypothetical protein K4B61_004286 [Escherichia coli]|nr:hypothetical protein [Escherichia sp. KCJ4928]EHY2928950.1 hypothetical protein [Escherichia coli]
MLSKLAQSSIKAMF